MPNEQPKSVKDVVQLQLLHMLSMRAPVCTFMSSAYSAPTLMGALCSCTSICCPISRFSSMAPRPVPQQHSTTTAHQQVSLVSVWGAETEWFAPSFAVAAETRLVGMYEGATWVSLCARSHAPTVIAP